MKRVVITGAGTINPLGHDVPATLEAMREGRCGIGPLEIRDVERLIVHADKVAPALCQVGEGDGGHQRLL